MVKNITHVVFASPTLGKKRRNKKKNAKDE